MFELTPPPKRAMNDNTYYEGKNRIGVDDQRGG